MLKSPLAHDLIEYLQWVRALEKEEEWGPVEWFDVYSGHAEQVIHDFARWKKDRIAWLLFNSESTTWEIR